MLKQFMKPWPVRTITSLDIAYNITKNNLKSLKDILAKTKLSDKISDDLRKRGFKFVGSTIVYAHMQATGMVNDHITSCYRHTELKTK